MKWFYNLKRTIRNVIAVVSWLPLAVFSYFISDSIGANGENMQAWQTLIFVLLFAVAIVFTVFAVKARRNETKEEREAIAAAKSKQSKNATQTQYKTGIVTMSENAIHSPINEGVSFPRYTKAVGVTYDNCQERIQKSKVGDALIIRHKPTDDYPESTDIINARTRGRLGRINSDLAWELLTALDEGFVLDGVVADITGGGDGENYGCNIEITGEHCGDE